METSKSVPDMHEDLALQHAHTLDELRSDCVKCDRLNGEESMVQCDICQTWWHFTCAGVSDSIDNRAWSCENCQVDEIASIASKSHASHNSVKSGNSARLNLQLEKLEELQAMQKKFIEDKYKLLESQLELEEENKSVRSKGSRLSKRSKIDKVVQWVNSCAEQTGAPHAPTIADVHPTFLPPASSHQIGPFIATPTIVGVQTSVQCSDVNLHSPLKHSALPTQKLTTVKTMAADSKTGSKQNVVESVVFNKITGTVPLAQSTPTQTQSDSLVGGSEVVLPPQSSSLPQPPVWAASSQHHPASMTASAPAELHR
ncbi:uncharacterized protein LOC134206356 [Armigeres subalbatus]|uniref:uncharacterized protein LOC134206356 n=1 Tax=Armigeres subalbatus TaxID=124917 RepID=UPI002ED29E58